MIERDNLNAAWKQVRRNKGAAGVDGLDLERTATLIRKEWDQIEALLRAGRYRPEPPATTRPRHGAGKQLSLTRPEPVRRVEIPKPNGGIRLLGVPTVMDRFLQQAALQVLSPLFEPHFSEHSYGFRPGRSAHQAVLAARGYQRAGKRWVVDIDLASFFDEVNHDLLMARVRRRVKDVRMLKLIRAFLQSGVMIGGVNQPSEKGTPQGGPLSPLLSNILLDDLDKELETLNPLLRGWMNYFRLSETKGFAAELDGWIRRRLRGVIWRQWKRPATRYRRLRALGLDEARVLASGRNGRGPQRQLALPSRK